MYLDHFGLNAPPFKITPDPQLFYTGSERGLVLEALVYAITQGEGMVKVVGEVGSGKTMLCRMLPEKLPANIEVLYLANPRLTPDTILHAIALEMRLPIAEQNEANHLQVMQALHTALLEKHAKNQQVVLLIEEAQGMPIETLEEIRLLSNLETTRHKLLQIVLFGQPELDENLAGQEIRQLRERITHSFYLSPLSRSGVAEYLDFRMRAVGYRGPSVFTKSTVKQLHKYAQGLLRRANILADKALLAAFSDNSHQVLAKHVQRAAQDSGFKISPDHFGIRLGLVSLLLVLAIASGSYVFLGNGWFNVEQDSEPQSLSSPPLKTPKNDKPQSATPPERNSPELAHLATSAPSMKLNPILWTQPQLTYLQQRLLASRDWLQQVQTENYTIQLLQIEEGNNNINAILNSPDMQALQTQLYILPNKNKVSRWRVFYGSFDSYQAANTQLQQLPARLRESQPFVRRIETLTSHLKNLDWKALTKVKP